MDEVGMVTAYLRGQNLEQLGRIDDAIAAYEVAVEGNFDSTGPYDRLITLYGQRAEHGEVIRVVNAALEHVRTYPEKQEQYRAIREKAEAARSAVPQATPKND